MNERILGVARMQRAEIKRSFILRLTYFGLILATLCFSSFGRTNVISCYDLFSSLTEEQIQALKKGLLGNRSYLTPNWGHNVMQFKNNPEEFFSRLVPELRKVTELYDQKIEVQILKLESHIRKQIEKRGLSVLPSFAIRGVKAFGSLKRVDYLKYLESQGYVSEHGGNFFIFYPGGGSFLPQNTREFPSIANLFFARLYASVGSTKRYAGGFDGEWGINTHELSAVAVISLDTHFQVPINKGNDGIDGSFPYSFATFQKLFHLDNLDVGNFTRRRYPEGVPVENVVATILSEQLPGSLRGSATDSSLTSNFKEIAQTRWTYLQVLKALWIYRPHPR